MLIPARAIINGVSHSGFSFVNSLSRKIRENAGVIMPRRDEITEVRITNTIAVLAPTSLFFAYFSIDCGLPSGKKLSSGSKNRQTPVNESSKTLIGTVYVPFAGSFNTALLPLKPSRTTK